MRKPVKLRAIVVLIVSPVLVLPAFAFEREDYEEDAGSTFGVLLNPDDGIYGLSAGAGTWLKGTPVFGDYFVRLFSNDIEDAVYSGLGMTLRLMPHWTFAPFVGGGGSYNYSFSDDSSDESEDEDLPDGGDSYWGGHAECGLRLWTSNRLGLLEVSGRYTWSSLDGERDYWLAVISTGTGF